MQLSLWPDLHAYLRFLALRFDVGEQELIRDVMVMWVRRVVPRDDPMFSVYSIGYHLPPAPRDDDARRYPGDIERLRFKPEAECMVPSANEPPPLTRTERLPWADRDE